MYILGISCYFHDSSAALIKDGKLVCAVAEERLSRIKHDGGFPQLAIEACLREAGITIDQVSHVGIAWKPSLRYTAGFWPFLRHLPKAYKLLFSKSSNVNIKFKNLPREFVKRFGAGAKNLEFHFLEHHLCHAASSYYHSGFDKAAILTIDASGEVHSAWLGKGEGNRLTPFLKNSSFHSMGWIYASVTEYLGFEPDADEWKVMGLAPYGRPTYCAEFEKLVELTPQGMRVDLSFFDYPSGQHPFYSKKFVQKFGPPRKEEDPIEPRHEDIAFAVQHLCEQVIRHMVKLLHEKTGFENLCMAGGVALNGVANGKIMMEGPFKRFFCQPAAGDDGNSVGAASLIWHQVLDQPLSTARKMENAYLGPSGSENDIVAALEKAGLKYRRSDNIARDTAKLIADGKIIGWFQGRQEFGPRALGNRSIVADPRDASMKEKINAKIKFREGFRPFAPSIREEKVAEYFEFDHPAPFMLLVYPIKKDKRDVIPAVTHVDGTGRLQTVTKTSNPRYYQLIEEFEKISGVPVVLNTSFNVKGDAIASTPADAIECFNKSGLDCLVLGDYLVEG